MWRFSIVSLLLGRVAYAWPSVENLGTVGGQGARGGIGDIDNPVLTAQSFVTDQLIAEVPNDLRRLSPGPAPVLNTSKGSSTDCGARRVVVDATPNGAQQEMLGFGFAWTDSTVTTFKSLEVDVLDQVMEDLFGQEGLNMGLMRHTIGSSDLSSVDSFGSYDDNGPGFNLGEPDPELLHFDLGQAGTDMAEMIALMGSYKSDVFLFGSPWSYPGWMKNNALFVAPNLQNAYNILNNSFNTDYILQAVKYFAKYVDAFMEHGVRVNGLTLMNEPLNYQGGYPCMYLDAVDAAAIITNGLGEAMRERGIKVIAYDHNTDQPAYPYRVWQSAPELVDAVAWHCYQSPAADYSVLDNFRVEAPDTLQLMSECSSYLPLPGQSSSWIAQHFIAPVRNGASGGTFWVLGTDPDYGPHSPYGGCAGCLGAIIVNSSSVYTKTLDYYMMGHFSRYVRRGAVNHCIAEGYEGDGSTPNAQFYIMAVQNPDQSWAIVFMNNMGRDENVVLSLNGESDQVWKGRIPRATVVTWLLPAQDRLHSIPKSSDPVPYPAGNATVLKVRSLDGQNQNCTAPRDSQQTSSSPTASLRPVPDTNHSITARYPTKASHHKEHSQHT